MVRSLPAATSNSVQVQMGGETLCPFPVRRNAKLEGKSQAKVIKDSSEARR